MNDSPSSITNAPGNHVSDAGSVIILSYGKDLLAELATHIIEKYRDYLPDLTDVTVLLPSSHNNIQLRKYLLKEANQAGYQALLGPEIDSLANWINRSFPSKQKILTDQQRELMLVEALTKHNYLYGEASPWTFADSLLELFDELSERDIHLTENFDEFLKQIDSAYQQNNADTTIESDALMGEARLVHTLWRAWQQQMIDLNVVDRHTSYLLKLKLSELQSYPGQSFYLAGFSQFTPAETNWLKSFLNKNNTSVWLQCSEPPDGDVEYHPDANIKRLLTSLDINTPFPEPEDQFEQCLNTIYESANTILQERAKHFAQKYSTSPLQPRLSLFEARSAEHEAMAIDLQTRIWRIAGKKKIGIVTENRRLARRVRALLERANIELQDAAGWALSTTSAAATLERWLESVEEDFAYQPLMDLLKSPFFFPANKLHCKNRDDLLSTVHRFEQGVILKENISRGLERYRKHTQYRQNRLTKELAAGYEAIYPLLDIIEEAAKPLIPFIGNNLFKPYEIVEALGKSLELLELDTSLSNDDAGRKILDELKQMQSATGSSSLKMDWSEFRNWLGRTLERFNFQPNIQTGHVQLMSMTQSPLYKFDALIIAGAEREYLPGSINSSPFFNDGVRQALGLSSHTDKLSHRFYQFRRLLESSREIVITRRVEHEDEHIVCSPWVERIKSFHTIAYGDDLINQTLTSLVGHPETIVTDRSAPLPKPINANPGVSVGAGMIPKHISASAYQQLIDCPYQFFAAKCLKLEPLESIKEMLEKSDYGERVHLCLHAFHTGAKDLPGPFNKPLTEKNREESIGFLTLIAEAVFEKDLEDNFLHRAWLKRWHDLIPAYIDWQIGQAQNWKVDSTELDINTSIEGLGIPLRGRIDRVDINTDNENPALDILDYKTGLVASEKDVLAGESVQLPFYALLARQYLQKPASRVEYVSIGDGKVRARTTLEGETLSNLTHLAGQRLIEIISDLENGKSMKAWGDQNACDWCQMSGVCRRESWLEDGTV